MGDDWTCQSVLSLPLPNLHPWIMDHLTIDFYHLTFAVHSQVCLPLSTYRPTTASPILWFMPGLTPPCPPPFHLPAPQAVQRPHRASLERRPRSVPLSPLSPPFPFHSSLTSRLCAFITTEKSGPPGKDVHPLGSNGHGVGTGVEVNA